MLIKQVAEIIEEYAPISSGEAGDELGLLAGDPEVQVKAIATCWSPTLAVLEEAADWGANMVIGHEPLTYGMCGQDVEAGLSWYDEKPIGEKIPNQKRLKLVSSKELTVYRYHSNWDFAPRYGISDALENILELGNNHVSNARIPVCIIEPTSVGNLTQRTRKKLDLGPIRVVGDVSRMVTRVGLCYGGFGQMFTMAESVLSDGAEVAFFGEMLDYTIRYCVETNLAAIELGHFKSERPGMIAMANFLREKLPKQIPVREISSGQPWIYAGK